MVRSRERGGDERVEAPHVGEIELADERQGSNTGVVGEPQHKPSVATPATPAHAHMMALQCCGRMRRKAHFRDWDLPDSPLRSPRYRVVNSRRK